MNRRMFEEMELDFLQPRFMTGMHKDQLSG
jgi:hypothetical protein